MDKKKARRKSQTTLTATQKLSVRKTTILVVALTAGVLIGVGWWKANHRQTQQVSSAPRNDRQQNREEQPREVRATSPEFPKLKGKWVRTDGGYIIDIKNIDEHGRLDAAYLNPRPIHVASAEVSHDGLATKVFIELRDVNYPGSTYKLTYDQRSDQLTGTYFQAVQQQRFEVTFERLTTEK